MHVRQHTQHIQQNLHEHEHGISGMSMNEAATALGWGGPSRLAFYLSQPSFLEVGRMAEAWQSVS